MLLPHLGHLLITYVLMGAVLLLAAGRIDWTDAWVFLIAFLLVAAAAQTWRMRIDPDLVEERRRWGANTKAWDR